MGLQRLPLCLSGLRNNCLKELQSSRAQNCILQSFSL